MGPFLRINGKRIVVLYLDIVILGGKAETLLPVSQPASQPVTVVYSVGYRSNRVYTIYSIYAYQGSVELGHLVQLPLRRVHIPLQRAVVRGQLRRLGSLRRELQENTGPV